MVRGKCFFICDKCKKIFRDLDIEWMATTYSTPVECPQCGSYHTRPLLSLKPVYKRIWKSMDEQSSNK